MSENLGGSNLVSKGHYDIFLASFDKNGNHQNSISIGSNGLDISTSIRINSENEFVISAIFSDTLKIGTKEFKTKGGMDILILKLDRGFNFIDGVSFGSSQDDIPVISLDNNDNILMTGSSYGLIKFGEEELTNRGDSDIILVKLTKDLKHIFSYTFGSSKFDQGIGITSDSLGNIYITGEISGAVDFGGGDVPYPQFNLRDFFLAKYLP
ncbi:MAG: SBBP repeat-containing protein [Deltaproteobacteria bacterium]|nr:SBBP repeat-containing protein [Deltaproteobacteria bacterium]